MRKIQFYNEQVEFPRVCPHCLNHGSQEYKLDQTFTYGRRTILLQQSIYFCAEHFRQAKAKSPAQRWCERLGLVIGGLVGLAIAWGLVSGWQSNGQGSLFPNLLIAFLAGGCFFITIWAAALFWISPLLATTETKAVLHSVRMTKYDPHHHVLDLTFANDTMAELTARENLSILGLETTGLKRVRITAQILSHEIRLNRDLKTQVLVEQIPTIQEAEKLLVPVIEQQMVQNMGVGSFYEISNIEVTEY